MNYEYRTYYFAPKEKKVGGLKFMLRRIILACILGLLFGPLFTMNFTSAADDHMGEKPPSGYGTEPCRTKMFDMATSQDVYTDRDMHFEMNFIGCNSDTVQRRSGNICTKYAYQIARNWIKQGQPILNLTVDKVGRALEGRMRDKNGIMRHDCALNEDWSWS